MTPSRVVVSDLRKRFGRLEALRGLDVEIRPGRITAVVGPNAAGKTTFIKTILGLVRPERGGGCVAVDGITVNGGAEYRERIGEMPPGGGLPRAVDRARADPLPPPAPERPGGSRPGAGLPLPSRALARPAAPDALRRDPAEDQRRDGIPLPALAPHTRRADRGARSPGGGDPQGQGGACPGRRHHGAAHVAYHERGRGAGPGSRVPRRGRGGVPGPRRGAARAERGVPARAGDGPPARGDGRVKIVGRGP